MQPPSPTGSIVWRPRRLSPRLRFHSSRLPDDRMDPVAVSLRSLISACCRSMEKFCTWHVYDAVEELKLRRGDDAVAIVKATGGDDRPGDRPTSGLRPAPRVRRALATAPSVVRSGSSRVKGAAPRLTRRQRVRCDARCRRSRTPDHSGPSGGRSTRMTSAPVRSSSRSVAYRRVRIFGGIARRLPKCRHRNVAAHRIEGKDGRTSSAARA